MSQLRPPFKKSWIRPCWGWENWKIVVRACDDFNHDNHIYLAPFHLTNPELLTCYEEIMSGGNETEKLKHSTPEHRKHR